MSGRATTLVVLVIIAAGVIAWMLASSPERVPTEPGTLQEPGTRVPGPGIEMPATPLAPPNVGPRPALRAPVEQPPAPPGSFVAAPPVAPLLETGTPHFPLDAGVRFPLNAQGIKAAVQDAKPDMQHCYEEWVKVSPSLQGRLIIGFRIASDGGPDAIVDRVRLVEDGGMGNAAFEGCILSVMQDLRFDAPESGDLEVTYPMLFTNDGGP